MASDPQLGKNRPGGGAAGRLMNRDRIFALLREVESGSLAAEAALEQLARFPFVDTPSARVDTQRGLRQGLPEVIFGPGKSVEQIIEVVRALADSGESVLVTRVEPDVARAVGEQLSGADYDAPGRFLWFGPAEVPVRAGSRRAAEYG